MPGQADPVRIPRQSEALYLLQRIRDEAHRFAITYHRQLRGKRMTTSVLDDVPGLGPTRRKRLVKELGGVKAVQRGVARRRSQALPLAARRGGRRRVREGHRTAIATLSGAGAAVDATSGRSTPAGGRTGSPTAPTPSTRSRSCRWRAEQLAGAGRVLDVGMRRGPGRPAGRSTRAPSASSASTRPGPRSSVAARARRRTGLRARRAPRALPFATASFDAVVACLVFEHIDDVDDAIAEVARVLRPGGRFVFFLNHPLLQTPNSGWIDDQVLDPPEQYWRIGPYLDRGRRRSRRSRRASSSRSSTARSAAT